MESKEGVYTPLKHQTAGALPLSLPDLRAGPWGSSTVERSFFL
jgi:hypothetical protein